MKYTCHIFVVFTLMISCKEKTTEQPEHAKGSYGADVKFLKENTRGTVELYDENGKSRVLLSAEYQGRVMTSTASGDSGTSFGWINYDLIASGEKKKQFNPVGGEERFWLGPEGGQYSIYFAPKDSFSINKWQVPAIIDTVTFDIALFSPTQAFFQKKASIMNYSGEVFNVSIERQISMLTRSKIELNLDVKIPEAVRSVAYETQNSITNLGPNDWTREKGLLSVWLLGMMTPTKDMVVIIPFHPSPDAKEKITTTYFGDIPADRLQINDSVLYFTCDGKFRSKIGLSPDIAKPIAASFDFGKNVLTIIQFGVFKDEPYVNSKWEIQKEPYRGDVVNSYNDGPLADGSQLGPFYELESSSPAFELDKDGTGWHFQSTYHFEGDRKSLNVLAKQILGVDLDGLKR